MVASGHMKHIDYIPFKHPLLAELAMAGQAEVFFIFRSSPNEDLEDLEDLETHPELADEMLS